MRCTLRPTRALLLLAVLGLLLATAVIVFRASSRGPVQAVSETAATPTAGGSPSATATGTTGPSAVASTAQASGVESTAGPTGSLAFADVWNRRDELTGQRITVTGKVLFVFTCPPDPGGGDGCTAGAYLTDPATTDLPSYDAAPAIQIWQAGRSVGCGTMSLADIECAGWRDRTEYVVTGTLDDRTPDGTPSGVPILQVESASLA